jgi:GntR family transcriptional regulator, transcriptional repressor for pyruvate dehydrogenase complex
MMDGRMQRGPGTNGKGRESQPNAARGTELVEYVVERLEEYMRAEGLAVGDRLPPERQLASEFDVSRATVREALHELELKGQVERRQGRGTVIIGTDRGELVEHLVGKLDGEEREVLELMDFREAVEVPVAGRAARYATQADIARLRRIVDRMASTLSRESFAELDSRFHYEIGRASHNVLLARVIEWSNEWTLATRSSLLVDTRRRRVSLQGHRRILEAISERDPDRASDSMRNHLRDVTDQLLHR